MEQVIISNRPQPETVLAKVDKRKKAAIPTAPPIVYLPKPKGETWAAYWRQCAAVAEGKPFVWVASECDPKEVDLTPFQNLPADAGVVSYWGKQGVGIEKVSPPDMKVVYVSPAVAAVFLKFPYLRIEYFWGMDALFTLCAKIVKQNVYRVDFRIGLDIALREKDTRNENVQREVGIEQMVESFGKISTNWKTFIHNEPFYGVYAGKSAPVAAVKTGVNPIKVQKQTATEKIGAIPEFSAKDLTGENKVVAFCFLTVDGHDCPVAWESFFAQADKDGYQYVIVNHSKNGANDFLKPHRTKTTVENSWERTVPALIEMIKEAKEKGANKAVIVSENCIPLKNPTTFWANMSHDFTLVTGLRSFDNDENLRRKCALFWGRNYVVEQWSVIDLDRHADILTAPHIVTDTCKEMVGDNEFWLFAMLRYERRLNEVRLAHTIHTAWPPSGEHPKYYVDGTQWKNKTLEVIDPKRTAYQATLLPEDMQCLLKGKCLTGRKFHPSTITPEYLEAICK